MPRCRPLAAAAVVAAVLLGSGAPVSARGGHGAPPAPTASDDPASQTTSTTLPHGIDVGHGGDQSGAVAPDADVQVEPADPDNVNQVLRISSEEAQARRDAVSADLDEVTDRIARMDRDLRAFGT